MKIGILTVPFNNNYGGLLQAFALKKVLMENGHEIVFINRQRNKGTTLKLRIYRLLVKVHLIHDFLEENNRRLSVNTDKFRKKYLSPITEPYYNSEDLNKCLKMGIEAFVVGSDQVWRYEYAEDSICDYYFNFLKRTNIPRYSYAASFGTDVMDYPVDKIQTIASLLNDFSGISVREDSAISLLSNTFAIPKGDIHVVLDPTLLLAPDVYTKLFKDYSVPAQPYVFSYILDRDIVDDQTVDALVKDLALIRVDLRAQTGNTDSIDVIKPVEEWLYSIYNAKYVVTDSFHGTVFSIIFNKPFVVLANPTRGITRLSGLLKMFNLEKHLQTSITNETKEILNEALDWSDVNSKLNMLRQESLKFIKEIKAS